MVKMRLINEEQHAGWLIAQIKELSGYRFYLKIGSIRILHNSTWLDSRVTMDGRIRLL